MEFREEVINVQIAKLLSDYGLDANPETIISHRSLPDVIILVKGIRVIIEGKFGNEKLLIKQSINRVEEGLCEICIALKYDMDLKEGDNVDSLIRKLKKFKYSGYIFYQENECIKRVDFSNEEIRNVVQLINNAFSLIVDTNILIKNIELVKQELEELVDYAIRENLWFDNDTLLKKLTTLLALEEDKIELTLKFKKDIIRIALFVLFDAMIFQESISKSYPNISTLLRSKHNLKRV